MNLYREESQNPKFNAQRNLAGRTHYVDDATLKCFKSRILESGSVDGGLLFYLIESVALDLDNTQRGYRPVIFNVFGGVISRVSLSDCFKISDAARKAMWDTLDTLDAREITAKAIDSMERRYAMEIADARAKLAGMAEKVAA